ncbi:hypothetical protein SPRG_09337 [Saprolegnia parasitica CBS 223.65]|uniref:Exonuclease domain-containing protein n=1 Tax=Saprolegnia parasitica (strain CBS 223.65) TaxID=695850 RepID=A0A067C895_SAPPC|nr:hypothetical protein SPRG_09337 [Saprolegnia parasitica CBS 223.65]KDO25395.1 hypothetical protein SPRG_09337 [Saprolegnia parasitica CBS 223.65]|eukprot:XP_012203823.1 hypothetical protein SPRG_09337 [Saprolegnia parasitica CBS 223.65]
MGVQYLLVLDFEATCRETLPREEMEIIEWPVVVIDVVAATIVAEFHSYIRPTCHGGVLAPFCTSLTGITQAVVDGAPTFLNGIDFCAPYLEDGLFVTCGDWDLNAMLPTQCRFSGATIPDAYQRWVNIKFAFRDWRGTRVRGMTEMLQKLGLPLVGRHHSGIDDTRNIAAIVLRMLEGGHDFVHTSVTRQPRQRRT